MKLNLGCGEDKLQGFLNVDYSGNPDCTANLEQYPWFFAEESSVDEVLIKHTLEHIHDLICFMNELYRVTASGAEIKIISPYYTSVRAWMDPTHVRPISRELLQYFDWGWRNTVRGLQHYGITADFTIVSDFYVYSPAFLKRATDEKLTQEQIRKVMDTEWNAVDDIHITLKTIKPSRG